MNITESLVAYIFEKIRQPLPVHIVRQAKNCLLDYFGVVYAGAARNEAAIGSFLRSDSAGDRCRILGTNKYAAPQTAAFLNGFHAHILELDDGHRYGMIHLAAPIISAVLAAAQNENADGLHLLRAICLGYEAAVRLSSSIQPAHKKRGYHTTGTCGTIGAAVGAGVILGLTEKQMCSAVSCAGTSAAGLLEIQENASALKPYNAGSAAMNGLNAAYMGSCGFQPPNDLLGGERGMVNVLADGADCEKMLSQQSGYEIERVYFKPYAACRHCHSALEAAMKLRKETSLSPAQIDKITVYTYQLAIKGHDHTVIESVPSAMLSIPFCVAAAYLMTDQFPVEFTEEIVNDESLLALTKKVSVEECKEFTEFCPSRRVAEVVITDLEGISSSARVDYAKGDPENPMTDVEIRNKFCQLMETAKQHRRTEELIHIIESLESDASGLYQIL